MIRKLAQAPTSRRRFFGLVGAAPLAAKQAAQQVVGLGLDRGFGVGPSGSNLKDAIGMSGGVFNSLPGNWEAQSSPLDLRKFKDAALSSALRRPSMRREIESILYDEHRHIGYIDHDLAVMRSISMSAKIVYQRQRNVQRALEQTVLDGNPWTRMQEWSARVLKAAGLKF